MGDELSKTFVQRFLHFVFFNIVSMSLSVFIAARKERGKKNEIKICRKLICCEYVLRQHAFGAFNFFPLDATNPTDTNPITVNPLTINKFRAASATTTATAANPLRNGAFKIPFSAID